MCTRGDAAATPFLRRRYGIVLAEGSSMPMPKLLVIDDDAWVRRMLTRTLGRSFAVVCAADVEEALAMIDGGAPFDVILCDLSLPGLSGHDFYRLLSRRSLDLAARVVISTGAEPAEGDAFAMTLGERYVVKTRSIGDLEATLLKVVALSAPCAPRAVA